MLTKTTIWSSWRLFGFNWREKILCARQQNFESLNLHFNHQQQNYKKNNLRPKSENFSTRRNFLILKNKIPIVSLVEIFRGERGDTRYWKSASAGGTGSPYASTGRQKRKKAPIWAETPQHLWFWCVIRVARNNAGWCSIGSHPPPPWIVFVRLGALRRVGLSAPAAGGRCEWESETAAGAPLALCSCRRRASARFKKTSCRLTCPLSSAPTCSLLSASGHPNYSHRS